MPTARELARAYDRCLMAQWWDGEEAARFVEWLEQFWVPDAPPPPDDLPDAVSFLGVRWYERSGMILGYEARRPTGCHQVPASAVPPPLPAGENAGMSGP